jgi:hypothetical protein
MKEKVQYSFSKRGDLINNPRVNQLVWLCEDKVDMKLVIINKGQYLDSTYGYGRVSNFWYWQEVYLDGTLGKEEYSYGHFYEYRGDYKVNRTIELV